MNSLGQADSTRQAPPVADTAAAVAGLQSRGFAICKPDPGKKKPTYTGWPTRSLEPSDFAEGDPLGIICGPLSNGGRLGHALVVPDLDALAAVERADEFLPPTGMMEGREGKPRDHRYYLAPLASIPDWARSTAPQAAPAAQKFAGHPGPFKKQFRHARTKKCLIDFLGTGGQVVCPYPGGRRSWVGGAPGEPAVVAFEELWDATCRLALSCGAKLPDVGRPRPAEEAPPWQPPPSRSAEADIIRRAIAYLGKCDPAVSGAGGHDDAYWPARVVCWGFDLGEAVGFDLLKQHFNHRCQPEWSDAELRHKCHDADTLPFSKPRGWLLNQERERPMSGRAKQADKAHEGNGTGGPGPAKKKASGAKKKAFVWLRRYRVPVKRVRKIGKARGEFDLILDDDSVIELGPAAQVLTPRTVQAAIADALRVTIPELKRSEWREIGAEIIRRAEVEDSGCEPEDELRGYVLDYVGNWVRRQEADGTTLEVVRILKKGHPARTEDGRACLSLRRLHKFLRAGELRWTQPELAKKLTRSGWRNEQLTARDPARGRDASPEKLRAWVSPAGWLRPEDDEGDDDP
jgi:hypothetical protein